MTKTQRDSPRTEPAASGAHLGTGVGYGILRALGLPELKGAEKVMTTIGDARCSWTRIVKPVVAAAVLVWTVAAGAAVAHAQSSDATDEAPPPPGDALPEPPTTVKGAT